MTEGKKWWDRQEYDFGYGPEVDNDGLARWPMIKRALSGDGSPPFECVVRGDPPQDPEDFYRKVHDACGGKLVYSSLGRFDNGSFGKANFVLADEHMSVHCEATRASVYVTTDDEERTLEIYKKPSDFMGDDEENARKGSVSAILTSNGETVISKIGFAGVDLEESNYSPETIEGFRFIQRDIVSESPSGRIHILSGPPGTGKTHLIRSLLSTKGAIFVLANTSCIEQIQGPSLLPVLLNHKRDRKGAIVLIVEDGDRSIVPRDGADSSAVTSLLNLGDGILGSVLDIRIVVTSNVAKLEMDRAILRPGRLGKHVEVGRLDRRDSFSVLERLTPGKFNIASLSATHSLAELYAMARNVGWTPSKEKKGIGFSNELPPPRR
jgi:hypothetical protein